MKIYIHYHNDILIHYEKNLWHNIKRTYFYLVTLANIGIDLEQCIIRMSLKSDSKYR